MCKLTFRNNGKRELLNICLEYKLFVKGYTLEKDYAFLLAADLRSYRDWELVVAFVDNEPVAVVVKFGIIMYYVKPKFRRQGIATRLYKELKKITDVDCISGEGIRGSKQFFRAIGQSFYKKG